MSKMLAPLAALFALFLVHPGSVDSARAQNIVVSKDLCGPALPSGGCVSGSGSALPVVAPNTTVSYQITLANPTNLSQSVDLGETFPDGFVPQSTTCGPNLPPLPPIATPPIFFGPVTVPGPGQITCTITGYFNYLPTTANNANNAVTVYPAGNHVNAIVVSNNINAVVGPPSTIPSNVSVMKTAQVVSSGNGTATVHYTITVTNNGPNDVYGLQLQDRVTLPSTSIPLTATYQPGSGACAATGTSDCFASVPSTIHSPALVTSTTPVDFVEWSYPSGSNSVLKNGESMVIEFDMVINVAPGIACQLVVGGNALINEAHIGFNIPGANTTTFEPAPGNNTGTVSVPITYSATIDPNCGKPALQITKTRLTPQPSGGFTWGSIINYEIKLHNASNSAISNIRLIDGPHGLGDFVSGGIGTPAFTAEMVGISCLSVICASTNPAGGIGTPQQIMGYLNPHWMLGTIIIPTMPPGSTGSFQLKIQYSKPECDSYPDVTLKPVLNFVRAKYSDPTLGADITVQSLPAIALFAALKPCNFKVTKRVSDGSQKIVFGQDVNYTVTYQNLNAQPVTIGTMIDALRIVQANYASPLTVHYDYTCSTSTGVTGFTAVGAPFPVANSGTVQVVHTALPQQGVRIIQNLAPVLFPGNSSVTCAVKIKVDQPSPGASQCARKGELENTAIMDQSAFYDPNLPWGSSTAFFAANVSLPLPQCFDLVVNKDVNPIWTTQNGGPLNYQLKISNLGDPIIPSDGVSLTDTFALASLVASPTVNNCSPGSFGAPNCVFGWSSPPPNNPSTLKIQRLAHNWSAIPNFQVSGSYPAPYPAVPGQVCNDAVANLTGLKEGDWYPKDPSTWAAHRCVPIFTISDLKVVKLVDVVAPALPPPPTVFTVDVNCSLVLNGTNYAPSQTFLFNYPPAPPPQGMQNIPTGSTCTIVEQPLSTASIPNQGCPSGFAAWGPIQYPNAIGPNGTPQSVAIGVSGNVLQVRNTFACAPTPQQQACAAPTGVLVCNSTTHKWEYHLTVSDPVLTGVMANSGTSGVSISPAFSALNPPPAKLPLVGASAGQSVTINVCTFSTATAASGPANCCRATLTVTIPNSPC